MSDEYNGPNRRKLSISDEQIEEIAGKAAEKALAKVYADVGQAVLKKAAWVIGVGIVALLMWLGSKGYRNI